MLQRCTASGRALASAVSSCAPQAVLWSLHTPSLQHSTTVLSQAVALHHKSLCQPANPTTRFSPPSCSSSSKGPSSCASSMGSTGPTDVDPSLQQLPGSLQTATLKDGRTVSYSVCGSTSPDAHTVLFLHPIQGNRFMALVLHAAAEQLNLRVIAPDRPGVGASTFLPKRTVQQYPADLAELCDQLGVGNFSVMASSAGTMYALACTLSDETRHRLVGKPTIIAPFVPHSSRYNQSGTLLSTLATWAPLPLISAFVGFQNRLLYNQSLHKPVTDLMTRSTPTEVAAFANDPHYSTNNTAYKHMISQWGPSQAGIMYEMQLCMERSQHQRLHFNYLKDITAPVRVIVGTADTVMPYQHIADWAQHAVHGNVELVSVQGGTHDGIMHTHKVKALQALAADVAASRGTG